MNRLIIAIAIIGLVATGCATNVATKSSSGVYKEDLSAYLPPVEVDSAVTEPVEVEEAPDVAGNIDDLPTVNATLTATLDSIAAYQRESINYIEGFTIQVYGGDSRNLAKDAQMNVIRYFPEFEPRMIFDQPNYKVRIGEYYTRLDAQPDFQDIRLRFRKAILVPVRLRIANN